MRKTTEFIHHFTCDKCLGWWSIASHENYHPKKMYCPYCAHEHTEFIEQPIDPGQ